MTMTLREELDQMHAGYVETINAAVAAGDESLVDELGAAYDTEAIELVADPGEPHPPAAPATARTQACRGAS